MYTVTKTHNKYSLLNHLIHSFHSSSSTQCHYATLGIVRNSSEKDIRTAYLQMAKKYHPDVNAGTNTTQRFTSINEAYSILSDKDKKYKYDSEIGNSSQSGKNWWDFKFYGKNTTQSDHDTRTTTDSAHDYYDDFEFAKDFYGDFSRFTSKNTNNTHHKKKRKKDWFDAHAHGQQQQNTNNPYADYYHYYYEQTKHKHGQNNNNNKQYANIWSEFEFDFDVEEEFESEFKNEAFWKFIRKNNKKQRTKHQENNDNQENVNSNKKHSQGKKEKQHAHSRQNKQKEEKEEKKEGKPKNNNKKWKNRNNDVTVNDIEIDLNLDFLEAANGCTKNIMFQRNEICTKCGGTSYESSIECKPCVKCDGKGFLLGYGDDFMCNKYKCAECNGRGVIFKNCTQCNGNGTMADMNKSLSIRIPSGIRANDRVRVSKQGHQYHDAHQQIIKYGNIVIHCKIAVHEYFERLNNDIHCSMNIPYCLAVLGGTFVVPTIHGPVIQKVSPPIQHNQSLRIADKGIYDSSTNKKGHMFVHFTVHIPLENEINQQQKQLLNEYAKFEQPPTPTKIDSQNMQQIRKQHNKQKEQHQSNTNKSQSNSKNNSSTNREGDKDDHKNSTSYHHHHDDLHDLL
eukprot:64589_1